MVFAGGEHLKHVHQQFSHHCELMQDIVNKLAQLNDILESVIVDDRIKMDIRGP